MNRILTPSLLNKLRTSARTAIYGIKSISTQLEAPLSQKKQASTMQKGKNGLVEQKRQSVSYQLQDGNVNICLSFAYYSSFLLCHSTVPTSFCYDCSSLVDLRLLMPCCFRIRCLSSSSLSLQETSEKNNILSLVAQRVGFANNKQQLRERVWKGSLCSKGVHYI